MPGTGRHVVRRPVPVAVAHSKDLNALGIDSVKFIYSEKLPELLLDTMTMTGLNLLSQFSTLVRISRDEILPLLLLDGREEQHRLDSRHHGAAL